MHAYKDIYYQDMSFWDPRFLHLGGSGFLFKGEKDSDDIFFQFNYFWPHPTNLKIHLITALFLLGSLSLSLPLLYTVVS